MTSCPECRSEDLETEFNYRYDRLECLCNKCGCEFEEETKVTILKHGTITIEG